MNGANLYENEYGVPLLQISFSLLQVFTDFMFSGIVLNIIIFFNVIIGTYEKRKVMKWLKKLDCIGILLIWYGFLFLHFSVVFSIIIWLNTHTN